MFHEKLNEFSKIFRGIRKQKSQRQTRERNLNLTLCDISRYRNLREKRNAGLITLRQLVHLARSCSNTLRVYDRILRPVWPRLISLWYASRMYHRKLSLFSLSRNHEEVKKKKKEIYSFWDGDQEDDSVELGQAECGSTCGNCATLLTRNWKNFAKKFLYKFLLLL